MLSLKIMQSSASVIFIVYLCGVILNTKITFSISTCPSDTEYVVGYITCVLSSCSVL